MEIHLNSEEDEIMDADDVRKRGKKCEGYEDLEVYQLGDRLCFITEEEEVLDGHWPKDP